MNKLLKGGLVMFGLFAGCSQEPWHPMNFIR
jgi:hypothetical protein